MAPATGGAGSLVLVELGLLEQRHKAVLEVLTIRPSPTARRYGVARQPLHDWLRR
jgi:hypothetical protein